MKSLIINKYIKKMSDDNLSLDSEDPNPEPYDPEFEHEPYGKWYYYD